MKRKLSYKKKRILFVSYGGGHIDIVLRLLPYLKSHECLEVQVLALTTAIPRMRKSLFNFITCADFVRTDTYRAAMEIGADLSKDIWDPSNGIPWEESCAYLGVSMVDLIDRYGEVDAYRMIQSQGRKAFLPERFMSYVLSSLRPDVVITTCNIRMERAAVVAAKHLGLTSIRIEDLFGYSMLGLYNPINEAGHLISSEFWPDKLVVPNVEVKSILTAAGFPKERIFPLGQPALLPDQPLLKSKKKPEYLKIWNNSASKLITYAGPTEREQLYQQASDLLSLASKQPEWNFCIKLHPSVGIGEFEKRVGAIPNNVKIFAQEPIEEFIDASDIVVIFRSTVGLLCHLKGKPFVVWDPTSIPDPLPYVAASIAKRVKTISELELLLTDVFNQTIMNTEYQDHPLFRFPEGAAERISNWLSQLEVS